MARAKTSLSLWDNHDGTWSGRFTIPELHGRILKTVTDAHTAPRRSHLDPTADPWSNVTYNISPARWDDYVLAVASAGGDAARALVHVKEAYAEQGAEQQRARDTGSGSHRVLLRVGAGGRKAEAAVNRSL